MPGLKAALRTAAASRLAPGRACARVLILVLGFALGLALGPAAALAQPAAVPAAASAPGLADGPAAASSPALTPAPAADAPTRPRAARGRAGAASGEAADAAALATPDLAPPSASAQRIFADTRARLLQVRTLLREQDSQASVGSAFIVDDAGLAITNYHVVSQFALQPRRYRLSFTTADGRSGALELLAVDVVHDLALVRLVADGNGRPAPTPLAFRSADQPLNPGERLYSLGNPLDVGFAVVEGFHNGLVERSYLPQIFFGGALSPGMSGGPAVDASGRVIGINVATRRDGQQVSFLVPARFAVELLARGRDAAPITEPAYAAITRQVQAHAATLVDRFVALPWRDANHPRYRVPVPREDFMRCWGAAAQAEGGAMDFERGDCVMDQRVFIGERLTTGAISVRHEAYDGTRLGTLRFARMYSESFRNESFSSGDSATAPRCREAYVEQDGLTLRSVVCLSALKRLAGLFNVSVLVATVDAPTQAVLGRLDADGVDFPSAMKLVDHYLGGFGRVRDAGPP